MQRVCDLLEHSGTYRFLSILTVNKPIKLYGLLRQHEANMHTSLIVTAVLPTAGCIPVRSSEWWFAYHLFYPITHDVAFS